MFVVTECRAQHGVWNLRILRVEVAKIPVVGEGFVIAGILVVGVRDLELRLGFVFAVRVVVDDGLKSLDRLVVIDPVLFLHSTAESRHSVRLLSRSIKPSPPV